MSLGSVAGASSRYMVASPACDNSHHGDKSTDLVAFRACTSLGGKSTDGMASHDDNSLEKSLLTGVVFWV